MRPAQAVASDLPIVPPLQLWQIPARSENGREEIDRWLHWRLHQSRRPRQRSIFHPGDPALIGLSASNYQMWIGRIPRQRKRQSASCRGSTVSYRPMPQSYERSADDSTSFATRWLRQNGAATLTQAYLNVFTRKWKRRLGKWRKFSRRWRITWSVCARQGRPMHI